MATLSFIPVVLFTLALYLAPRLFYRVLLSPLRKVPGPSFGRFSILWQLLHLYRKDYHIAVQEVHKRYGPCVRVSHHEVSVTGPEVVKSILMRPLNKHSWYKIFAIPDSSWPNLMSELDAHKFSAMQRKTASGYSISNLLKGEVKVDELILRFTSQLDRMINSELEICLDKWFTYFTFDIVGQVTFSRPFGFLQQGKDIGNCISRSQGLAPYLSIMAYFHGIHEFLMSNLDPLITYLDVHPMKHVIGTTLAAVLEHEKMSSVHRHDMLEHWKSQTHSVPLTQRELLAAANANVAAGADTVGSEMQAFVYNLLRNTECLIRLREELDSAAANNELSLPVQYREAQKLPYFQACIKETFRFHPVSGTSYPRVAPQGGIEIGGFTFPEGTVISVNPWVIHRDENIFGKDAHLFNPDRWLQPGSKALERNLIAFGSGYMTCPGKSLAHMQLSKLLSTMFLEYDIELAEPDKEWRISSSLLVRPHSWAVKMKKRDRSAPTL